MNTALDPEWLKVLAACQRSSIGRTSLYGLIADGVIKSCVIRKPGNIRGQRLISRVSLDGYLDGLARQQANNPES